MTDVVYICTSQYRRPDRWDEQGFPDVDCFIDGAALALEAAKDLAVSEYGCQNLLDQGGPARWFTGHRWSVPRWFGVCSDADGNWDRSHVHVVEEHRLWPHQGAA